MPFRPYSQRGAALVVGMILLLILTLLGITGMNIARTDLVMTGNEQTRQRAFQAAEIGIEDALTDLSVVAPMPGAELEGPATDVPGSPVNPVTAAAVDTFQATITYVGEDEDVPGFSGGEFAAYHYTTVSTGRSAGSALAVNTQGAYLINQTAGQTSYGPSPSFTGGAAGP